MPGCTPAISTNRNTNRAYREPRIEKSPIRVTLTTTQFCGPDGVLCQSPWLTRAAATSRQAALICAGDERVYVGPGKCVRA